jgi:dTDP-4-amino-4,6-dideoxygalactose transaminase
MANSEPFKIPFNRPSRGRHGVDHAAEALSSSHWSGDGPFSRRCASFLEEELDIPKALLTTSCTHALEMAAFLSELDPGEEVIIPSFTFVSTANAFVVRGAKPVFADIRPDTLNIDETRWEDLITPRTRALVAVHYAGVGCEMDTILQTAAQKGILVVEDNAHGLFGRYRERYLGTLGTFATQSFHETKNFSCGEGGALLINEPEFVERAEIIREKGTDRSRFFRGQVDKYSWLDVGSSYLPSDILAAILLEQLEDRQAIQDRRRRVWLQYEEALKDWAEELGIGLPTVPSHCEQSYHMFYLLMPSLGHRQAFIAHLGEAGILAVFHYLPLHLSPMGRRFGGREGACPVTESVSDCLVRLPFYTELTPDDQDYVIEQVLAWRPNHNGGGP